MENKKKEKESSNFYEWSPLDMGRGRNSIGFFFLFSSRARLNQNISCERYEANVAHGGFSSQQWNRTSSMAIKFFDNVTSVRMKRWARKYLQGVV